MPLNHESVHFSVGWRHVGQAVASAMISRSFLFFESPDCKLEPASEPVDVCQVRRIGLHGIFHVTVAIFRGSEPGSTGCKWLWVKTVLGSDFGVGEFTTHFRTYFSGDWDVHCTKF